jgi:hypothetical protein
MLKIAHNLKLDPESGDRRLMTIVVNVAIEHRRTFSLFGHEFDITPYIKLITDLTRDDVVARKITTNAFMLFIYHRLHESSTFCGANCFNCSYVLRTRDHIIQMNKNSTHNTVFIITGIPANFQDSKYFQAAFIPYNHKKILPTPSHENMTYSQYITCVRLLWRKKPQTDVRRKAVTNQHIDALARMLLFATEGTLDYAQLIIHPARFLIDIATRSVARIDSHTFQNTLRLMYYSESPISVWCKAFDYACRLIDLQYQDHFLQFRKTGILPRKLGLSNPFDRLETKVGRTFDIIRTLETNQIPNMKR